ncbi:unnamed protein product [Bursaphelenchus xylophilus]|uniref:protein-tyrosine-phosphatase n=1 Tax=Bursaphelenchus xylophilus TaxID=6326 RepID=A0A1I7RQ16_BURXY|nr:unnamed protein product [Bursaphelenchus xylophilus]CAG9096989.1 unnamed protein product [Bursaphelenchus xylophilus]
MRKRIRKGLLALVLISFIFKLDAQSDLPHVVQPSLNGSSSPLPHSFSREFLKFFRLEKSPADPARSLEIYFPSEYSQFKEFIARVTDTSEAKDESLLDANRTFRITPQDPSFIRIDRLYPGHHYYVAILGRVEDKSISIKEETVVMDPVPIEFNSPEAVIVGHTNITFRGFKAEKALQDKFTVKYFQLDPLKRYPTLQVDDIQDQKFVELYLSNLNPGRDYDVTVSAIKDPFTSSPWRKTITTKPLAPANLTISDVNATCIRVSWLLPSESGADQFNLSYHKLQRPTEIKRVNVTFGSAQKVDLCDSIVAGENYVFTITALKSNQRSESSTITHTVRPMPPTSISLVPDFKMGKFKMVVHLNDSSQTKTDQCQIRIIDDSRRIEQVLPITQNANGSMCVTYLDLEPGKRYDLSAAALSENTISKKILKNTALEPSFSKDSFGLSIQEQKGTLVFTWPGDLKNISELWTKTVGKSSKLHIRVDPLSENNKKDGSRQFDTSPFDGTNEVHIDHLRRGTCYKVHMYTVTNSGIVSLNKFEEFIRLSPPSVDVKVDKVDKREVAIRISVTSFMIDPLHPVIGDLSDCLLHLQVVDEKNTVILERSINFVDLNAPIVKLNGLLPYHNYNVNSMVICGTQFSGKSPSPCPSRNLTIPVQSFQTHQDIPNVVENFTTQVLNPYSVQLKWQPPAVSNGPLTHYNIHVIPVQQPDQNWTLSLNANGSHIQNEPSVMSTVVVDNLVGGLEYKFDVQAVNEAGVSSSLTEDLQPVVKMPILAPPRPAVRIEILKDSVRSTDLAIKFSSDNFSQKHGLLKMVAVIVAQVGSDGRPNEVGPEDTWALEHVRNSSMTWGSAQNFEFWPPYVALSIGLTTDTHLKPQVFVQEIGIDSQCIEQPADIICNGPLKPGTNYRMKLRLFTAPNLWTDSMYSDIVITEPLRSSSAFRNVFVVLAVFIAGVGLIFVLLTYYTRRHRSSVSGKGANLYGAESFGSAGQAYSSKESQWTALKMIMAERAADCLAKLGLDTNSSSPPSNNCVNNNSNVLFSTMSPRTGVTETNAVRIMPSAQANPLTKTDSSSTLTTPNTFNAHHRRSRSLRERTGVDQKLERLPSGPPPGSKPNSVLWTVMKGADTTKSRPIRIQDFPDHVKLLSADSDYLYSVEYEELRFVGTGQSCIAADLGQNRAKNRFTNILPYDHSRVKIISCDEEDGADYVNASYIPGFNSRREFIAAQGPLPSTRDHFWKIVWEQNCPAIVALTKCVEKGRDKCHQYWPDVNQRSVIYADVEVTLVNESVEYDEYIIRELRMTHLSEFGHPSRTLFHLHYMAWPDFGAPENPAGIINFLRQFRNKVPPSSHNRPSVIHCSAGVGRSGTFVALDRLIQNIEVGKPLDVFGTVFEMRMQRCHMVQNEQQYIFIHQALLYVLQTFYPHLLNQSSTWTSEAVSTPSFWTPPIITHPSTRWGGDHQNSAFMEDDEGIAESGL